ncbi:hypothetical protein [Crenobacter cavernae]|uniref:Uncharacterized protein n=1 Tax=Crenobacter cavernae TaxID=2290923 RepID=A0A345Y232_9NEIS|nr:hypothetical protein [Crenobacter cavernae]AXK37984.1 hypothetical protein DWG20_00245 [Crenobacter cavernae]
MKNKHRINIFDGLVYNGDWHTELLRAISLAEPGIKSKHIKSAIADLKHMLAETDECLHTVTVTASLPVGIEPNYLLKVLAAEVESEATVALSPPDQVALTMAHRGSHSYVEQLARKRLQDGITGMMYTLTRQNGNGLAKGLPSLTLQPNEQPGKT